MGLPEAHDKDTFYSDIIDIDQDFNPSAIDEVDSEGNTVLHRVLSHPKCTSDIIAFLLTAGAKVKLVNNEGNSPLVLAARHGCSAEVLKVLLKAGAKVNQVGSDGRSPLCTILHHPDCDSEIVRLVLSTGASAKACSTHPNVFHCYMDSPNKVQAEIIGLILVKVLGARAFPTQAMCLVLSYPTCQADIVNILLKLGSRFNLCLMHKCSFHCYLDESVYNPNGTKKLKLDVLKILADNFLKTVRSFDRDQSPLCRVLRHTQCSADAVKLLLSYPPALILCSHHQSPLHCYLEKPCNAEKANIQSDVLKALLDTGLDVNLPNAQGRTPLFMALHYFNCTSDVIKVLLDASASLSNCNTHISLLYCYVGSNNVEIEGMKMILSKCTNINVTNHCGDGPLHCALRYSKYQVGAIELLINHPDIDIHSKGRKGASYLHCALQNPFCKVKIVELLLNKGARINAVNNKHLTPIHTAVSNPDCGLDIIELLIDRGSSLQYHGTITPLEIALRQNPNPDLVRLLLTAGAPIIFGLGHSMLEVAFNVFDYIQCENSKRCFFVVVKFAILACHLIDEKRLIDMRPNLQMRQWLPKFRIELGLFRHFCTREVHFMMKSFLIPNYTLYDFVACVRGEETNPNIDVLLRILSEKDLTLYLDLISMKVDEAQLRNKLSMLQVYTCIPDSLGASSRRLFLNGDILCHLSSFLSAKDLLSYVTAYYDASR